MTATATTSTECVYLIRDNETGLHKIGMTANWARRSRELQVGSTTTAVRLVACPDALKWEKVLHAQFKHKRIPQSEWFRVTEEEVMPKMQWLLQQVELGQTRARYVIGQWQQAKAGHYYRRRKSQNGHWYTQTSTQQQVWTEAQASLELVISSSSNQAQRLARKEPGYWPSKSDPTQLEWAEKAPSQAMDDFLALVIIAGGIVAIAGTLTANVALVLIGVAAVVLGFMPKNN